MICEVAGEFVRDILVLIHRNQSRRVDITALKRLITKKVKILNFEPHEYRVSLMYLK